MGPVFCTETNNMSRPCEHLAGRLSLATAAAAPITCSMHPLRYYGRSCGHACIHALCTSHPEASLLPHAARCTDCRAGLSNTACCCMMSMACCWFSSACNITSRMYRCPGAGRLLLVIASTNAAPSRSTAHQGAKAGAKVDRSSRKYGNVWVGMRWWRSSGPCAALRSAL